MTLSNTIIVVVGPTASGKSKLATKIAGLYNGEIINADSRQIYRYLNIGTAKPSTSELQEIPHHLVDIINPDEKYSLGLFLKDANKSITKIFSVGKLPVVVGGSGQYIWALLEGWQVPEIPPSSQIRIQLENKVSQYGYQSIHKELADIDSAAASRIDARNTRRVIRALELNYLNLPTSSLKTGKISPEFQYIIVGLNLDRQILYNKIDIRVEEADLIEINEDFAAQVLAVLKHSRKVFQEIPRDRLKSVYQKKIIVTVIYLIGYTVMLCLKI